LIIGGKDRFYWVKRKQTRINGSKEEYNAQLFHHLEYWIWDTCIGSLQVYPVLEFFIVNACAYHPIGKVVHVANKL